MAKKLVLVSNPGSASRKYALYENDALVAGLHFEHRDGRIIYTVSVSDNSDITNDAELSNLAFAATKVVNILRTNGLFSDGDKVGCIGLRIVAPSTFFQTHRLLNKTSMDHLKELEPRASLHISGTLQETELLRDAFPGVPIWGISDSAFHSTKPLISHSYAISQRIAEEHDIWRFGYHGLSVGSVVKKLKAADKLPKRLIVCHLGSGASVTAVLDGKSYNTTMGYSPLEGLMMSTRTGNIDPAATEAIRNGLNITEDKLQILLNTRSGLLGVSGLSDDVRELLELEKSNNIDAKLALEMYIDRAQQGIGQMVAALGGVDSLVFTGTIGVRSPELRKRVASKLLYLGLTLDSKENHAGIIKDEVANIGRKNHPAEVLVVPCDEAYEIAHSASHLENNR